MKLMKNKKTKELVAAKFVERIAGTGISKNTEREIVNHRRLLHPNIIRFYEVTPPCNPTTSGPGTCTCRSLHWLTHGGGHLLVKGQVCQ